MNRLVSILAVAFVGGALVASPASASPDDQAAADEAIAAFNERMAAAGGESSGPPDTTPIDPEEYAAENPGTECFGEFATGLDPGGQVEGQTARADADHFSVPVDSGTAEVDAGILTVDDDHADTVREFVEQLGADEFAECMETAFGGALADATADAEEAGVTAPEEIATITVETEPDLGIGDASAHVTIGIESSFGDSTFVLNLDLYAAAAGRSLVSITVETSGESANDFDGVAELEALVDSL